MPYVPTKGDAILIPSGGVSHLHVVVTGLSDVGTHLLLNFSSVKVGVYNDPTCVVQAGSHPMLPLESFVAYDFARIEFASDLSNRVDVGLFRVSTPIDMGTLTRMRAGINNSGHCAAKFQRYFTTNENK